MVVRNPAGLGVDGFAMAVGGGLALLMINFLFRLGASGDQERQPRAGIVRNSDELAGAPYAAGYP